MWDTGKLSFNALSEGKDNFISAQKENINENQYVEDMNTYLKTEGTLNINVDGVSMRQNPKRSVDIDLNLLQTDLWFTGFGMTLKQLCNPSERILLETELFKYKPGIDTMYITRWFQLTKTSIRIYKNQMACRGFNSKPIIALPLSIFKTVKKSKFMVPEKGKNIGLIKVLNKNQFELFYKDEILNKIMVNFLHSKIIDREDEDVKDEDLDLTEKLSILKGNLTSNESFRINATMETLNNSCAWSNREGEWFCAEKRLLFSTQRSRDKEVWIKTLKKYIP